MLRGTVQAWCAATVMLASVAAAPTASGAVEHAGSVEVSMGADAVASRWGQTASFGVAGLPADATGTVAFNTADGGELCSADVSGGVATCSTPASPEVGEYAVTATYSGDDAYAAATAPLTWTVYPALMDIRVRVPGTLSLGSRAHLRAGLSVDPCSVHAFCRRSAPATGFVTWRVERTGGVNDRFRHRSAVVDGRASWWTPRLRQPGKYLVTATLHGTRYVGADQSTLVRVRRP